MASSNAKSLRKLDCATPWLYDIRVRHRQPFFIRMCVELYIQCIYSLYLKYFSVAYKFHPSLPLLLLHPLIYLSVISRGLKGGNEISVRTSIHGPTYRALLPGRMCQRKSLWLNPAKVTLKYGSWHTFTVWLSANGPPLAEYRISRKRRQFSFRKWQFSGNRKSSTNKKRVLRIKILLRALWNV